MHADHTQQNFMAVFAFAVKNGLYLGLSTNDVIHRHKYICGLKCCNCIWFLKAFNLSYRNYNYVGNSSFWFVKNLCFVMKHYFLPIFVL